MKTSNKSTIEVFKKPPDKFSAKVEVSACCVEFDDRILLMKRSKGKQEELLWGLPAGKVEKGENIFEAVSRELLEETGIYLEMGAFDFLSTLYIRKPEVEYNFHMFRASFDKKPDVKLSHEHEEYKWLRLDETQTVPLMQGAKEALHHYKSFLHKEQKQTANVNSYLILKKQDQILLALRKNTGYMDGHWCLVAGHAENGETPTEAIIREAKEEVGIDIAYDDLRCVHMMHRNTDRHNVDFFFACDNWNGTLKNCEPHKCEEICFFPPAQMPEKSCLHILHALEAISKNQPYSEYAH